MTTEGLPPNVSWTKTYEAQRRDRMGDCIGDYLTDEECSARTCYEEILAEVQSWIDYHEKFLQKAVALKALMMGNREVDLGEY